MAANTFAFEPSTSHYKALGISRSATEEDITRAFKKLSLIYHPDKAGEQSTGTFQHLVNARDTLLNQIKRSEYDDEHEDDSLTEAEGALLCGPRLSEKFREKFTQWNKEFFVIQRSSLHTFPQEFQNMLQKFSNGFLREQSYKSHPLAISYSDEGASQADDTRFSMSPSYSPVETTVNHVLQAVTSIEQEDSATQTKLNLIYKRAIDSGYSNYDPESNDLEPIVDFSTSPKADLQMLIQLLSADDPETIDMMNPSQLLGRLLRYVPRKLNSYLRDTTTTDQASNAQCGQCHTRFRWSKHQLYTCAGCENKFCKSCPPNSKQMYGFGSSIEVFVCHSCLEKVYHEHAKEWLNRAHAFIEGGNLEDLKATFGCIQIAVSLFRELNLTTIGKKLLRHNYPELALPFAISAQQQASTTIETVKANHFLSSVLKSLAATHTDPNVSWELLLGAKEAALVAKMEADNLDSQIADAPSLQTAVDEINQQLHLSKAQKEDEEEKKLRTQKQEIEGYWSSRNLSAMINLIRSTKDESEHAHKLEAFEKFMQTMETYISKMLPDDRYSLIFFRGVLKLLKKRYAEGISDIEQVVWQSHSVELLKTESINIILSLLTNQPSIFTLQGLHKICMHPRMLLSKEKLPNDCMRELQLITLDETEITPPFPRRWPELSVSGLNLRAHRKCEAAFDKQIQEKKWGPQDVGYAYIDYIQGCHHPAEIIVSVLHSSMWFLKDLKENKSLQQCEKFALKKLIFSLLGLAYVTAHRNSHPGMQLYVGRSALAVALETIKTVENVAEEEDTQLISSLLHMVTYNSRFVPFWNCPSVPVSEAALLSIISAELHSKYLDQLKETDKKQRPMSEAELQYQLYENNLRYVHRAEEPENLHTTAMKELLAEKGWKMSDVSSLMTSPLTIRDRDGWIIQQPKLGQEQEFAEVKGLMINLDHENPSIELVVVPADDSRGRQGTCSQTDFRHVLSMVDEANGALFFSLDQPDDQKKFHPFQEFRYTSESIYKTDLLHTLFETDYLMKSFSVGADVSSKPPFKQRPNGEGLTKNLPKRLQEKLRPVSERGTTQNRAHRFWIQADNIDYTQDQNNGRLEIRLGEIEMIIRSHPLMPGEDGKLKDTSEDDDPDSPEAKFAADMTEVYNELGLHFPMFLRLRQLAKLQVLGVFLRSLLQGMKEKSEGKGVIVPTELLQEIQHDALQSIKEQLKQNLNSISAEVGVWPEAEDRSKVSSEVRRVLNELPYNVVASYSDVEPLVVSALEKKDESAVSQIVDGLQNATSNRLSQSTLRRHVSAWLRNRTYQNLDAVVNYVSSAASLPTREDIRSQIIEVSKKRYAAFYHLVRRLSLPNQNSTISPCKWVPAALHKEEDDNHLSLCYGGVLIAPKVNERHVPCFPRHSQRVPVTQTSSHVYTNIASRSSTRSTHSQARSGSRSGSQPKTQSGARPQSQSSGTKSATTKPQTTKPPTTTTKPPTTRKWDFSKKTTTQGNWKNSGKYSRGVLRLYEDGSGGGSSSSGGSSSGGATGSSGGGGRRPPGGGGKGPPKGPPGGGGGKGPPGGGGKRPPGGGGKGPGDGKGPGKGTKTLAACTAVAVAAYATSKLLDTFGDPKMKTDAALREVSKSRHHNPNCKRNNCRSCALNKVGPVTAVTTADGRKCKTTKPVSMNTSNSIYLLTCKRTGKSYVGMTTREAITRLKEHLGDIAKGRGKTLARHFNDLGCFGQFEKYMTITPLASVSSETMKPYDPNEQKRIMEYVEAKVIEMLGRGQLLNKKDPSTSFSKFQTPPPKPDQLFSERANGFYVDEKQVLTFTD